MAGYDAEVAEALFGNRELWERALSNHELNAMAKILDVPYYRGAISRDDISKGEPRTHECFILNTEKSTTGDGLHWVGVIRDEDDVYYFNSYGKQPLQDVLKRYSKLDPHIEHSPHKLQEDDNGSVYCGMITLYVLYSYWKETRDFGETLDKIDHLQWSRFAQ